MPSQVEQHPTCLDPTLLYFSLHTSRASQAHHQTRQCPSCHAVAMHLSTLSNHYIPRPIQPYHTPVSETQPTNPRGINATIPMLSRLCTTRFPAAKKARLASHTGLQTTRIRTSSTTILLFRPVQENFNTRIDESVGWGHVDRRGAGNWYVNTTKNGHGLGRLLVQLGSLGLPVSLRKCACCMQTPLF